jgi:hypothetical protein
MNKETLEEAAERHYINCIPSDRHSFIAGAKYQADRMYSEEELKDLLIKSLTHKNYDFCGSLVTLQGDLRTANFEIWFDYYKKK